MRITLAASQAIDLGRKGENEVNKVVFPVRGWKELYGDGEFALIHQRPTDDVPYPCTTTLNGTFVEWVIGSADVAIVGRGKCELRYIDGNGARVKSVVYDTIIHDSLGNNSLEPPEPWESWVDEVTDAGTAAIGAAEDAEDYKDAAQGYASDAQGYASDAQGYASAAESSAASAASSAASAVDTAFNQITATANTLQPGASATASFNTATKVLSLGIPKGDPGSGGGGGGGEENVIESISYNSVLLSVTNKNVELKPTIDSAIAGKENAGKIKISGTEYTVTRKALTITNGGTTTTYYVADIT